MYTLQSFSELAQAAGPFYATVGFFDGLHLGHQHLIAELNQAAALAGTRSLVITFENSPRIYHRQPDADGDWRCLTTVDEKLSLLAGAAAAWTLILPYDAFISGHSAEQFLRLLLSKTELAGLCVGYDTSIGNDMVSGFQLFSELTRKLGLALTYVEPFALDGVVVKSSLARNLLQAGRFSALDSILGHHWSLTGIVISGKGRGAADLGIPTANLLVPPEKMTPPEGIYAGLVQIGGEPNTWHPASLVLVNQGCLSDTVLERGDPLPPQPLPGNPPLILEAHLLDYSGELYGRQIQVRFVQRLREWRSFDSVDALRAQITNDVAATIEAVNTASGAQHAT